MGMRAVCGALAVGCAVLAPTALAGRSVSVGYSTPSALHGLRVIDRIPALHTAEVRVPDLRAERSLRARPGIRFVQRVLSRVQTAAPSFALGSSTAVPEWQWTAAHEDLVPAWVQQAASRITIAVVDTGADVTVPAIAAKAPVTYNVVNASTNVRDVVGHGTFVASLAAGAVAQPGAMSGFGGNAKLMIVQANRGGTGFSDIDEANGIVWAVDNGANIVNLSLGGSQTSTVERYAIQYAIDHHVLLVAAAGNSAQQGNPVTYPAALLGHAGIVVGAATAAGQRASFSTTGAYVDVLAPGVDVLGALGVDATAGFFNPAVTPGAVGSYAYGTGTSYAAPEVSGAAALVWAANPLLDPAGVAAAIESSASNLGTWLPDTAYGNLDVASAVQRAAGGPAPAVAPPTIVPKPKAAKASKRHAATKKTKRARAR
jgi:subtilisin family serine protease